MKYVSRIEQTIQRLINSPLYHAQYGNLSSNKYTNNTKYRPRRKKKSTNPKNPISIFIRSVLKYFAKNIFKKSKRIFSTPDWMQIFMNQHKISNIHLRVDHTISIELICIRKKNYFSVSQKNCQNCSRENCV